MEGRLGKLSDLIDKASQIVVVGHYNPDGDAMGSSMALYYYLKNSNKSVKVVMPNPYPDNLAWMDRDKTVLNYKSFPKETKEAFMSSDLVFCMDFQSFGRTDQIEGILESLRIPVVLIDHHIAPAEQQFALMFSETRLSSTCELLYSILSQLNKSCISKEVAECIYAGISTDTGSFSYSCSHKEVFERVADLIGFGADVAKVHRLIYDTFSEQRLRLLGYCLSERLFVLPEYKTAFIYLSKAELERFQYKAGDTEGIVNYALSMGNILFAAFFTERDSRIRISFRSKGNIDVNTFAKKYFNGGGHKNAAGGNSYDSLEASVEKFTSLLPEFYAGF